MIEINNPYMRWVISKFIMKIKKTGDKKISCKFYVDYCRKFEFNTNFYLMKISLANNIMKSNF